MSNPELHSWIQMGGIHAEISATLDLLIPLHIKLLKTLLFPEICYS